MQKCRKFLMALLCLCLFLSISVIPASAATTAILDWYLVDSGKHLDWKGSTSYQTQFNSAVSTWNNYKSGVIRKDAWNTINDVTISDYNEVSSVTSLSANDKASYDASYKRY